MIKLPLPPPLVFELLKYSADASISCAQVVKAVQQNSPVTSSLVALASSGQCVPGPRVVTNLARAVQILGPELAIMASLGTLLANSIGKVGSTKEAYRKTWYEGVVRAAVARRLACKVCPRIAGEAYLVGLLQDSGKLALLLNVDGYESLLAECGANVEQLLDAEKRALGGTHLDAAREVCADWGLDDSIRESVALHARPALTPDAPDATKLRQIGYLLRQAPVQQGSAWQPVGPDVATFLRTALDLSPDNLDDVLQVAACDFAETRTVFRETIPPQASVASDLRRLSEAIGQTRNSVRWLRSARVLIVCRSREQERGIRYLLSDYGARRLSVVDSDALASSMEEREPADLILRSRWDEAAPPSRVALGIGETRLVHPISVYASGREMRRDLTEGRGRAQSCCIDGQGLWQCIHQLRMRLHSVARPC